MADVAFAGSIAGLFNSKKFSDVIIRCKGQQWSAHKAVICMRSEYFDKACDSEFKEGQNGIIDLEDDDPAVVHGLLSSIYTGDYDDSHRSFDDQNVLTFNVQIFASAEKYLVEPLQHLAAAKFKSALQNNYTEDGFTEAVEQRSAITSDLNAILGNIIIEAIMERKHDLLGADKQNSTFREAMSSDHWLTMEITTRLCSQVNRLERVKVYRCPGTFGGSKRCFQNFQATLEPEQSYKYTCERCNGSYTFTGTGWQSHVANMQPGNVNKVYLA